MLFSILRKKILMEKIDELNRELEQIERDKIKVTTAYFELAPLFEREIEIVCKINKLNMKLLKLEIKEMKSNRR